MFNKSNNSHDQSSELATTQGISIVNCGPEGDLLYTILQASLGWLFAIYPNSVEITIIGDVYGDGRYTVVTVEALVGTTQADVDLCVTPGNTSLFKSKISKYIPLTYINPFFDPTDGLVCVECLRLHHVHHQSLQLQFLSQSLLVLQALVFLLI